MTIERSHGKARPTLTRSSDLRPDAPGIGDEQGRDEHGRATHGNQIAVGRGWKNAIRKQLTGAGATDAVAEAIVRDTVTVYQAIVRDLASTGPLVRANAAGAAREFALAGFYDQAALEAGLLTERGMQLVAKASQHRQRFERMSVTTRDLARVATPRKAHRSAAMTIRAELARETETNNAE